MRDDLKYYKYKGIITKYFVSPAGDIYREHKSGLKKLVPTRSSSGYLKIHLSIDGKFYNRHIHRMVAETFIPNPENKPYVNHKDGNKHHNWKGNLEWSTAKENSIHAYNTGLMGVGENFSTSDITNLQCEEICKMLSESDKSILEISDIVGCSRKIIDDILHRKTWIYISADYDFSNRIPHIRITENDAINICKLLSSGRSSKEISNIIGCKIHQVKDIKRRKTWSHVSKHYNF